MVSCRSFSSMANSRSWRPSTISISRFLRAVGQPKYQGPSKISELDPAMMEKVVKKSSGARKKGPPNSWLVFFYADWSDSCVEHEPMLADLSLRYSSDSLQFGKIDVNKWSDLALENRISVSTSSWQLPTLILFQNGEEVMRLPQIDDKRKVTKTVLDRVREPEQCCLKRNLFSEQSRGLPLSWSWTCGIRP
uniref:Thioredoxin domain-containing protein n=1 Tax=Hyaloperonospora arabidopsidis (strain Emoy2) TaxID=559515 RepID=M4B2N0_HYAAE